MINVLVKKLPTKVGHDWAEHKQKEKAGTMDSEDKFRELMEFLRAKKEVTKDALDKQEIAGDKSRTHSCYVMGQTITIQQQRDPPRHPMNGEKRFGISEPLCIVCKGTMNPQDAKHWTAGCEKLKALRLPDRKRLTRCQRHLQAGDNLDVRKCQSTHMSQ